VTIESRTAWEARTAAGKFAVIPLAILSDRTGGHYGPSSAWKPFGDVLRLPVPLHRSNKTPTVLDLSRQGSGRALAPNDHQRLVDSLKELQEEGLVDLEVTTFSSAIPFQEQVAKVSTSDVSIRSV
jgi:hypothetical protein